MRSIPGFLAIYFLLKKADQNSLQREIQRTEYIGHRVVAECTDDANEWNISSSFFSIEIFQ